MAGNTFGNIFRLTTFGESHGEAVGGVIDGMPSMLPLDTDFVQAQLNRRRPGQSKITTSRSEDDKVTFLSGVMNGLTTGCPIAFEVRNTNQHSSDYANIAQTYRPSHADYTYDQKWGIRDHRGGGRSSARETIARVVGGALAQIALCEHGITVRAYTSSVGDVELTEPYTAYNIDEAENNIARCPDSAKAQAMIELIERTRANLDSVGGTVTCVIKGAPAGLGEPCFDKLQALLAHAMLSIGAVKGFEYGSGFAGTRMNGSAHNDTFYIGTNGRAATRTNNSGGIQGGISNGEDIYMRVAFKPTATILMPQRTINSDMRECETTVKGRHDPCVVPRAVPIVEAMAALVMEDALLMSLSGNAKNIEKQLSNQI